MPPKRRLTAPEPSEPSEPSESSELSESPGPIPTSTKKPDKPRKTNARGIKKDGTPTAAAKVYTILKFDTTKARALQAEHIRTLIRQSGCTGVKHENTYDLMYTILFGDETTLLHFRQFQQMWQYRSLSPTAVGPQAEWWTAFRLFLRDCFSKAKAQIDKSGYTLPQTYSDEVGKIMPVIALEGDDKTKGKGRARREAVNEQRQESQPLWPLPPSINLLPVGGEGSYAYRNDPPPGIGMPGPSGSGPYAYMAVIIDPDKAGYSSRNGIHDLYDPFGAAASRTFTNVARLTLLALFQSVKRLTPDRGPRALYGCLVRPRNPIGTVDADGVPDPIQEQRARDLEQTYSLRADDTTLLWSDRTVKTFFDTVQKPPWVLVILRRNLDYKRGDTPPRGPQVTLDPVGTVIAAPRMPTAPQATPKTRRDIIAAMDRVERMKRRMEEQLRAVNDAATELGLEKDPLLIRARKRLRISASSPGNRRHSERNIDDKRRGIREYNNDMGEDGRWYGTEDEEAATPRRSRRPRGDYSDATTTTATPRRPRRPRDDHSDATTTTATPRRSRRPRRPHTVYDDTDQDSSQESQDAKVRSIRRGRQSRDFR